jgi:prevent-host-death family protein
VFRLHRKDHAKRGSSSATVPIVPVIPQKELRNNVADVLRRAEAGEEFTITVAGRPVAQLGPTRRRQWVSGPELAKVWSTPAPQALADDLERFPAELADPFA